MTTAWLQDLEEKVQEASARLVEARSRITELEAANDKLEQRNGELEASLETASEAGEAAWAEERDDIRERVEKLSEHLGKLLEG